METIFEFNYNNKKYISLLINNQIVFGCIENGIFKKELTDIENRLLKSIYNYIVGDKEHLIPLTSFEYNNNNVIPYYNEKNRLYYFQCDDKETLKSLNYLFNNQSIYLYVNNQSKIDKDKFRIFARLGSAVVAIMVSASIVFSTLPIIPRNELLFDIDYRVDSLYKDFQPKEVDDSVIQEALDALKENTNLTYDEKKFLQRCSNELEENKEYINFDQVTRNFSELRINYHSCEGEDGSIILYQLGGRYSYIGKERNLIDLYGDFFGKTFCNDFSTCNESDLVHEMNHALSYQSPLMNLPGTAGEIAEGIYLLAGVNTGQLLEMSNELFSREYLDDFSNQGLTGGYQWIMPPMYALAEIIDPEVLRTYQFNTDNYYITKYLLSIGVPKEDIYDLYKSLDLAYGYEEKNANPDATMRDYLNVRMNYKNIYRIIGECYECKYNRDMNEDLNMLLCFYNTEYVKEDYNEKIREILNVEDITAVIPRGYVSKRFIAKHPYYEVYTDENLTEKIEITDDIRYLNNAISNTL